MEGNELGAAFGLEQLKKLNKNIKTRNKNFKRQVKFFSKFPEFFENPIQKKNVKTAWLAFPILLKDDAPFSRKEFQIFLEKRNIQTRVVFTGNILRQPMSKNCKKRLDKDGFANSDKIMRNGVLLPLHHGMTDQMFKRLHSSIEEFITLHTA